MPGKFATDEDETVYALVLDGMADEELGSVQELGYHAIIRGHKGGLILSEDSQGFVTVENFDDTESLDESWSFLKVDYAEFYADNPDY